jgi:hypothetical protein
LKILCRVPEPCTRQRIFLFFLNLCRVPWL